MKKVIVQVEFQVDDNVNPDHLAESTSKGLEIVANINDMFDDVRTWDAKVTKELFAVCYGYRDELCVVEAETAEEAETLVKNHIQKIGYDEEEVEELAIVASCERVEEIDHVCA